MKLHTEDGLMALGFGQAAQRSVGQVVGGILHVVCTGHHVRPRWDGGNRITVAHPHLAVVVEAAEEGTILVNRGQVLATIFARTSGLHVATAIVGHKLRTIADAEHGQTADKLAEVRLEGLGVVHTKGAACQDDTNHIGVVLGKFIVRQYFAESIQFAQTACNQLCRLATEI